MKTMLYVPVQATDPVSRLKGCGKVTTEKLNAHGIYDCQSLLNTTADIPSVNLEVLRKRVRKALCPSKDIMNHSWKNMTCHIIRAKGHVTRAVIDNLVIGPHSIMLKVKWKHEARFRCKLVSPVAIMCTQVLWSASDIVSDDSDNDSCDPKIIMLPKFLIDTNHPNILNLTELELKNVQAIIKETNQLYNCVYQLPPGLYSQ